MPTLTRLFEPITIRSMQVRNRIVMPSMVTNFGTTDGEVTQQLIDYFVARARGGVGLIITEATYVRPDGKGFLNEVGAHRDELIPGLRRLTDAVHAEGAKIALQIYHAGRQTVTAITGLPTVGPSPIPDPTIKQIPHELTVPEIHEIVDAFGQAARRAKEAGFDAVEIHGAHGYLIAAFLSPFSNRRLDEYGGSTRRRARFALQIVQRVRAQVGEDFPIQFRISGEERVEGGLTLDQTRLVARLLEEAGVDSLHVSVGNYATPGSQVAAPLDLDRGTLVPLAAAIKKAVSIPVVAVGRLNDPLLAEQVLEDGSADLVAIGRGLIADPELPNKALEGQLDDITPCIACNQACMGRLMQQKPISCMLNPAVGREAEFAAKPAEEPRRIVVVGGGPAGLSAARYLALRGHHVKLFEASQRLGGEFAAAAMVPKKEEIADALRWMIHEVDRLGVEVELGFKVNAEDMEALHPDAVVLASGGVPIHPTLPGIDGERVVVAQDVLFGEHPVGERVLVVGAGSVGLEVAEYLATQLKQVTVIEMTETVGQGMDAGHLYWLSETLEHHRAQVLTGVTLEAIEPDGQVRASRGGESVPLGPFDTIVLAVGYRPNAEMQRQFEASVPKVYVVGDASAPRTAVEAIHEGAAAALAI